MSAEYVRGLRAAEEMFDSMWASGDWDNQCSTGFAATYGQMLHHLREEARPEGIYRMLDRHLRDRGDMLRLTVDTPTGVWSACVDDDMGRTVCTAGGPVEALELAAGAVTSRPVRIAPRGDSGGADDDDERYWDQ